MWDGRESALDTQADGAARGHALSARTLTEKIPGLRALAARAPYFHIGSAEILTEVVEFYDRRFSIGLTGAEKADLVAFLRAL